MKNLITILILFVAVGCGKSQSPEDKVVGTYERKVGEFTFKLVFLENGVFELYETGEEDGAGTWTLQEGEDSHGEVDEVLADIKDGVVIVLKIETNGDLTFFAWIKDGKRSFKRKPIYLKKVK